MDRSCVGVSCLWLCAVMFVAHGNNYVNVALNKSYSISSSYMSRAPAAANGDTVNTFPKNCILTVETDNERWWRVDLGRNYELYNFDVWGRTKNLYLMYPFNITIDGRLCAKVTDPKDGIRRKSVNCSSFMVGRNVTLTKIVENITFTSRTDIRRYFTFCEIRIYVCIDGFYGKTCSNRCQFKCRSTSCIRATGLCVACPAHTKGEKCDECETSYHGTSCDKRCTHSCLNNKCNKATGLCDACHGNYSVPTCTGCKAGFYGTTCNKQCQSGCKDNECNKATGKCNNCHGNFRGDSCSECKPGFYGPSCKEHCQHLCLDNECNNATGLCDACPGKLRGKTCTDCKAGFYGKSCDAACINTCENNQCLRSTGLCGSVGTNCSDICLFGECNETTGNCYACPDPLFEGRTCSDCRTGFYGSTCNESCQYLCLNNECNKTTGLCDACPGESGGDKCSGCAPGFYGPSCNASCPYSCRDNQCNRDTGLCEACPENYEGDTCANRKASHSSVVEKLFIVIFFIAICIAAPSIIWLYKRRKARGAKMRGEGAKAAEADKGPAKVASDHEHAEEAKAQAKKPQEVGSDDEHAEETKKDQAEDKHHEEKEEGEEEHSDEDSSEDSDSDTGSS